jgi:hypothetical protein
VSVCRVACRVALSRHPQNTSDGAQNSCAWVTKVLHYQCPPFLPEQAGRWVLSGDGAVVVRPLIGGRSRGGCGGTCRAAWRGAARANTDAHTPIGNEREEKGALQ